MLLVGSYVPYWLLPIGCSPQVDQGGAQPRWHMAGGGIGGGIKAKQPAGKGNINLQVACILAATGARKDSGQQLHPNDRRLVDQYT